MPKARKKHSAGSSQFDWLATAIGQATRSAQFCVAGGLPVADPGLVVPGLGRVTVPLKRGAAKALIAACHVAPYGKGTETLIDERVRKTLELDPQKFRLSDEWNSAIADATRTVADALGLSADQLEARLYKLLVYERGGFFLPHRDSEKHDRMVASMIVVLPNPFEGGRLIVRHGAVEQKLTFKEAAAGKEARFAAFYADCEHEVERVTYGVRIALAYNLVLNSGKAADPAKPTAPADTLVGASGPVLFDLPQEPRAERVDAHVQEAIVAAETGEVVGAPPVPEVAPRALRRDVSHVEQTGRGRVLEQEREDAPPLKLLPGVLVGVPQAAVLLFGEVQLPGVALPDQ